MDSKQISIVYTNYKGETKRRNIIPITMVFSSNKWHKEQQLLLLAYDVGMMAERTFAMKDIRCFF